MVAPCQHCDKTRILVARVTSDILDELVCFECATLAARLVSKHEGVFLGELKVVEHEET
jgi:hypothetical protein